MGRLTDARKRGKQGGATPPAKSTSEAQPADAPLPRSGLASEVLGTPAREETSATALAEPAGQALTRPSVDERLDDDGSVEGTDDSNVQLVTFSLGAEEYGLPIEQVQEINRVGEITRVPNVPSHVLGVMNLRGRIVPVVELKRRLHVGEVAQGKDARIIVVEHGRRVLGLMVDRVAQVIHVRADEVEPAPAEVAEAVDNCTKGVANAAGRMVIVLDLDKVVARSGGVR